MSRFPWKNRVAPQQQNLRVRITPGLLGTLANRLTNRDRWLLHMLYEHRVLTTPQITQLTFGATRVASARLSFLFHHRAIDRFRPVKPLGEGSAPFHWVLDDAGATVLSAYFDCDVSGLGYRRGKTLSIAHSAKLRHTVSANNIFTTLAATARKNPFAELKAWWSEPACARTFGDIIAPDGYGHWRNKEQEFQFFLEYDTGTEPLTRVHDKISHYCELHEVLGTQVPVLFVFPTLSREQKFQDRMNLNDFPAATTTKTDLEQYCPAAAIWQPLQRSNRQCLAELSDHWNYKIVEQIAATGKRPQPPNPFFLKDIV